MDSVNARIQYVNTTTGEPLKSQFKKIKGYIYYFDKNGYVVTGWLKWNGCYFYLNPISDGWFGRMETGWKKIDGKWYYLEPVSGQNKGHLFVKTVTPDGYKVDSNGAWMK